jgi:peptidoglycan/LPS O-acetylase OafA/YrhL
MSERTSGETTASGGSVTKPHHPHVEAPPLSDPGKDERAAEGVPVVPAFDGFRAFAILGVVFFHVLINSGVVGQAGGNLGGQAIWGIGPELVDILFIVSGFVVFLPTVAQRGQFGSVKGYAIRRGARLLPAYWLSLVVMLIVMVTHGGVPFPGPQSLASNFAGQQTLVQMIDSSNPIGFGFDTPLWTLTLEIGFYIVLPFIAASYFRHPFVGLAIALAIAVLWRETFIHLDDVVGWFGGHLSLRRSLELQFNAVNQLPNWAFSFAAGMTGAWAYVRLRERYDAARVGRFAMRALLPALLLFTLFVYLVGRKAIGTEFPDGIAPNIWARREPFISIGYTASLASLMLVIALLPMRVPNPFANPFARKLGDISYGVYLIQAPVLWLVVFETGIADNGSLTALLGWMVAVVPVSLLYGYLSARFVEQPIRRWAHRFGRRAQTTRPAPDLGTKAQA